MARNQSLLPSLLVLASFLFHPSLAVIRDDFTDLPRLAYDFVIVGGGTAGSVLASRLTEDPDFNVLLIEAGPSHEGVLESQVPGLTFALQQTQYDWNFNTVPQIGLNNRTDRLPRGRMLGGSSSINGLFYTRGSSDDYDRWAAITGDSGWSWSNILPYLLKVSPSLESESQPGLRLVRIEREMEPSDGRSRYHRKVFEASQELGGEFAYDVDMNDGTPLGFGWLQSTINNGERSSAATGYLDATVLARPNLHVLVNNRVVKLAERKQPGSNTPAFQTVHFQTGGSPSGRLHRVTAKKEVILAAGAYGSPQLLMLSGIGDSTELQNIGIEPKVKLPSVGKNLTEHVQFSMMFSLGINDTVDPFLNQTFLMESMQEWFDHRTGYMTNLGINSVIWHRLPEDWPHWSQFEDPTGGINSPHIELVVMGGGIYPTPGPNLIVSPVLASPRSRGFMTLNSTSPYASPLIDPAMLTHPFDILALRESVRSVLKFVGASTWDEYNLTLLPPFAGLTTDEEIYETLRNVVTHVDASIMVGFFPG
ncbi:alcohol dehydrogenase [Coprinopsis cinerea okayama7|uniref:pyranose dehydrogenase (acceptor) n=1 Tax=Coprinopsis cinerea (strain Okayama-7 / 130 / ATCC MYA-4618 / FGSC 9003) TaxID=240176 RepID=D6RQM8_COPC7|nr:alcohol dehydrogenase [Coprinopsis cinerea okayama7\|eukprot:XP_002910135.1 alcohol dehydrogenase [Coprinopsis cinerea okayama7\